MPENKIYQSKEIIEAEDLYQIQDDVCCTCIGIKYQMTKQELQWLNFVKGRYSIADYILERLNDDILKIDDELSRYLDYDCKGAGKAVCLSDDSALQRIFFWCYSESDETE